MTSADIKILCWSVLGVFSLHLITTIIAAIRISPTPRVRQPYLVNSCYYFTNALSSLVMMINYYTIASDSGWKEINISSSYSWQFYYVRYVAWAIALPCILINFCASTSAYIWMRLLIVIFAEIFLVCLMVGSFIGDSDYKWGYMIFSLVTFVTGCLVFKFSVIPVMKQSGSSKSKISNMVISFFITSLFLCQIVVWILTAGTHSIEAGAEAIIYAILDIVIFMLLNTNVLLLNLRNRAHQVHASSPTLKRAVILGKSLPPLPTIGQRRTSLETLVPDEV